MLPQCTDGGPGNQPLPVEKKDQKVKTSGEEKVTEKKAFVGRKMRLFLISSGICAPVASGFFVPNSKVLSVDAQMKLEQWEGAEQKTRWQVVAFSILICSWASLLTLTLCWTFKIFGEQIWEIIMLITKRQNHYTCFQKWVWIHVNTTCCHYCITISFVKLYCFFTYIIETPTQ